MEINARAVGASLALTAVLCTAAVPAQAVDIDWGTLSAGDSRQEWQYPAPGSFMDTYSFYLGTAQANASSAVALNFSLDTTQLYHISGGSYSLFSKDSNASFGTWAFDGTSGDTSHTVMLTNGGYYFGVSGVADGTNGGIYGISTAIAPIPEPETYALLLTGLAVLGFASQRRRRLASLATTRWSY